jgi:hypothetical protein
MRRMHVLAMVGALFFTAATPAALAQSKAGVKAGFLTCDVASGYGFVFGSSRDLKCVYAPVKGKEEHYTGTIEKWGVDIGYLKAATIMWAVFAPTEDVRPGMLAGEYGGLTAAVSLGLGVGANVLGGGNDKEFQVALQPISVEGNQGLNLAAGIGAITLEPAKGN